MRGPAMRSNAAGQALVEFAIVLALLMVIVVTSLQMVPAIAARGVVLNAASTAVARANSYLTSEGDKTLGAQTTTLCNQILAVVRIEMVKAGSPAVTAGNDGCRNGNPTNARNPVVSVTPDAGVTDLETDPKTAKGLTVCVTYRYTFSAGLIWLASKGPGDIGSSVQNNFIYRFCGRSILDANRTR